MKAILSVVVVVAVAGLVWALSQDSAPERLSTEPVVLEEVEDVPEPVELLAVFDDEVEAELVVEEAEVAPVGPYAHMDITEPRVVDRRQLPDGRWEIDVLTPVYFGNGTKKNIIRRIQAMPRVWPKDRMAQRQMTEADHERARIRAERAANGE